MHSDRTRVRLTAPEVVSLTIADGQLWFHTESGQLVPCAQYKADTECKSSFLGFCLFFILDAEDTLTEVRISSVRARHRLAIFRPKSNTDFTMCMLLFAIESLPLSKHTLECLMAYLIDSNPRTGLTRMIRRSCVRLVCTSLYLFFDVTQPKVTHYVPQVCILYKETQRANASMLAQTYFGVKNISEMSLVSLCLTDRHTEDGDVMGDLAADVLNTVCNVFYAPIKIDGGNVVTHWLSNDGSTKHEFSKDAKQCPSLSPE